MRSLFSVSVRRVCTRGSILIALVLATLSVTTDARRLTTTTDPAFDPVGLQPARGYFSQLPGEMIDMVNGHLTLRYSDLALPGNAGMDLAITRTYNRDTAGSGWFFGFVDVPLRVTMPVPPPLVVGEQPDPWTPALVMGDGSTKGLEPNIVANHFVTTDFWRYQADTRTLYLPNGWVATYEQTGNPSGGIMLVEVHDQFGNSIVPTWIDISNPAAIRPLLLEQVVQHVHDEGVNRTRTVSFQYTGANPRLPSSMTYDGRTWTYQYGFLVPGTAYYNLTSAQPPTGTATTFEYTQSGLAGTVKVTLPTGGTVLYELTETAFQNAGPAVAKITTGGRDIAPGVWTINGSGGVATVTTPGGRQIEYTHAYQANWSSTHWVLIRKRLLDGTTEVAKVERTYTDIPFKQFFPLSAPATQVITQGGNTFTTTNQYSGSNFGDYLRPWQTTESSSTTTATRVTTRSFDYDFTGYIAGKVASETVAVGSESITTNYSYDDANGFLQSATKAGITTTFGPDSHGNIATTTDALSHQTSIEFQWGVAGTVATPQSNITRSLNPDGSVASENHGGVTTSFGYDTLGRVTAVHPAEGASTTTSYAADGSSVTVTRGPVWTVTTLDGFGRPIATENSAGVRTTTTYDVEGRKTFQSYPFVGTPAGGDTFLHDALGRITRVTHADNSFVSYAYTGTDVSITDENGHTTVQHWIAFGDPADGRLVGLTDAKGANWSYSYNALGSLTRVVAPEGPDRVWAYNGANLLASDTQPESGTTTYQSTAEGLLLSKTDAENRTTTYGYDGNHRLVSIDAPGAADDVTFNYDARDNRIRAIAGDVDSVFTYDGANRLVAREDRIQGQVYITVFSYDARDNLTSITYPSGRTVQYGYDAADRLTQVSNGTQIYADQVSYHASGALAGYRFGNQLLEAVTFDARHRPSRLTSGQLDLTYQYDGVGNVLSITDPRPTFSASYTYDELDRLKTVSGFGATVFDYDPLGNRLSKGAGGSLVTYAYDPGTKRLSSATSPLGQPEVGTFQYDHVGNMKNDGVGGVFTYNARNLMATAEVTGAAGTTTTSYTYNADGLRVQKSSPSGQQYFVYGLGSQLLAEYAALFVKLSPHSNSTGTNGNVTLTWSAVPNATFEVCYDTSNNATCNGTWTSTGAATSHALTSLSPGTYYWQVRATTATGTAYADASSWWSFTINSSVFGKLGPPSGQSGLSANVTVQWAAVPDSGYWVCWDTTNNNSCDGMWWPNGGMTSKLLEDLTPATYFWQVRADTPTGVVDADAGEWWSFTVGGGSSGFSKLAPAPGLSGLSSNVTLQWTTVPNEGYWVCWDTSDNNTCDTTWYPNGGMTSKLLEGLAPGTYFWQVKTSDSQIEANGGVWWPFTVGQPVVTFGKVTPGAGAIATTNAVNLVWSAATGASFYEVCIDTSNNGACDTSWQLNGVATSRIVTGLTDGTYYWQVRAQTANGITQADAGLWWSLSVDAPDPIREYIYFGSKLLASLTLTTGTPVLTYYHADVLGSVRAITDAAGATLQRHDYAPFGESASPMTGDPRRFTGKERDPETAFDYFEARYYRNVWGRFTTVDPEQASGSPEDPQGWNAYAYGRNNPLRFIDPSGQNYLIAIDGFDPVWIDTPVFERMMANPDPQVEYKNGIIYSGGKRVGTYRYFAPLAQILYNVGRMAGPFARAVEAAGMVAVGVAVIAAPITGTAAGCVAFGCSAGDVMTAAIPLGKIRKAKVKGKQAASDVPSWAKGQRPKPGENGRTFAKRLLDEKYGTDNYPKGPGSEFSKLQKYGDRAFEDR